MTINGITVRPSFLYRFDEATLSSLKAQFGQDAPMWESGDAVTLAQDIDMTGGIGRAVKFNQGDHFSIRSGDTNFGTGDFVFEFIIDPGEIINPEKYIISNYHSTYFPRFSLWAGGNTNNFRWYMAHTGGGCNVPIATLTAGTTHHVICFAHRSGNFQPFLDGVAVNGDDMTVAPGATYNGVFNIGGGALWGGKEFNGKLAWLAGWEHPNWMDTSLQTAIAEERYKLIFGA